jgi:hypothetical protein
MAAIRHLPFISLPPLDKSILRRNAVVCRIGLRMRHKMAVTGTPPGHSCGTDYRIDLLSTYQLLDVFQENPAIGQ